MRYAVAGAFAVIGFIIGGGPQGAMLGWSIGSVIGGLLFPEKQKPVLGPRLQDANIQVSTFGTPISWVWGNFRLNGNVIWMTKVIEVMTRVKQKSGKGAPQGPKQYEFTYFGNFAVAICRGPIHAVHKIWADGKLIYNGTRASPNGDGQEHSNQIRVYFGTESQTEISLMAAYDGAAKHPAYRGVAVATFGPMYPLKDFGNRIPQMSFEVASAAGTSGDGKVTLQSIVSEICEAVGLDLVDDVDVSGLGTTNLVTGFSANNQSGARAVLEPLQTVWQFDGVESDGLIKFNYRNGTSLIDVLEPEFGTNAEKPKEDNPLVVETRTQDIDLASKIVVKFANPSLDYEQGAQYYERLQHTQWAQQQLSIEVPVVMDNTTALETAKKNLFLSWAMRTSYEWTLPQHYAIYDPGDVMTLHFRDVVVDVYVTEMGMGGDGTINFKGSGITNVAYVDSSEEGSGPDRPQDPPVTDTDMKSILIDGPLLDGDQDLNANAGIVVAGYGESTTDWWTGGVIYESPDDTIYEDIVIVPVPANVGKTSTVLAAPGYEQGFIFDYVSTVQITLHMPIRFLENATEIEVLAGANRALIQTTSGWELIGYTTATYDADGVYTLSGLLRGIQGTEWTWDDHALDKWFVPLDATATYLAALPLAEIGLLRYFKSVSFAQEVDPVTPETFTNNQIPWKPLAPCHARANYLGDSAIKLSIQARPRTNVELRNLVDTPIDEQIEQYKFEIYTASHAVLKRTLIASGQKFVEYSVVDQTTDFGGLPAIITVSISQVSPTEGPGLAATRELHV